jgi:hypothetical protein
MSPQAGIGRLPSRSAAGPAGAFPSVEETKVGELLVRKMFFKKCAKKFLDGLRGHRYIPAHSDAPSAARFDPRWIEAGSGSAFREEG